MAQILKQATERVVPRKYQLPLRFHYNRWKDTLDPEMFFVAGLLERRRRFLDIGANMGFWSCYFRSRMQAVDAFEPLAEISDRLRAMQSPNVSVHNVALSNRSDTLPFYIPTKPDGTPVSLTASLEPPEGACVERIVPVSRLDDFGFEDVDLIKIDVEGHELSVLEGAMQTIRKTRPVIMAEIEQRHIRIPIGEAIDRVLALGYDGAFLDRGKRRDIAEFDHDIHQAPYVTRVMDRRYVNNFIFTPTRT